jgi:hypothetical protein
VRGSAAVLVEGGYIYISIISIFMSIYIYRCIYIYIRAGIYIYQGGVRGSAAVLLLQCLATIQLHLTHTAVHAYIYTHNIYTHT